MTYKSQILSILSDGRWKTTTEIARGIPYTLDFASHRRNVYHELQAMWERGKVFKLKDGPDCIWKVKG